jgi:hypothetical protein
VRRSRSDALARSVGQGSRRRRCQAGSVLWRGRRARRDWTTRSRLASRAAHLSRDRNAREATGPDATGSLDGTPQSRFCEVAALSSKGSRAGRTAGVARHFFRRDRGTRPPIAGLGSACTGKPVQHHGTAVAVMTVSLVARRRTIPRRGIEIARKRTSPNSLSCTAASARCGRTRPGGSVVTAEAPAVG